MIEIKYKYPKIFFVFLNKSKYNKTMKLNYIIISLITSILISCNTVSVVSLDVRRPASISFDKDIQNVIIVDNTPINGDSIYLEVDKALIYNTEVPIDSSKVSFFKALTQFMNDEHFFERIGLYNTNNQNITDIQTLSKEQISNIKKDTEADAIIAINQFDMVGKLENPSYYVPYALLELKSGVLFNIYTSDGEMIYPNRMHTDSLFWNRTVEEGLPNIYDAGNEIAITTADNLTKRFIPYWETQERLLYSDNSKEMKQAAKLFKNNEWKEAAKVWGEVYYSDKSKTSKQVRAAANIALTNEYLDDIENALIWISIADNLLLESNNNKDFVEQITSYKKLLEQRLYESSKVRKQLNK